MSAPTEIRCTACGRPASTADRYCGFCGSRLDAENATPTAENTGPHRPHGDRILTALRAATIGEYDIAGEIGRGGMAVVFLAHDLSLNRKVAIKALLPELLYTEGMDRRFKHEARIAAKLDHPNILVIHSVREANDLLYIVMKLVEGLPLSTIAKVSGPLPIPVVKLIVRHVADALAYAHGEGVVHRDVKPANIMVDRRGNVVVMDFGIAKAADDAHLTRTGLVIGTPAYMSPEQCLAQGVTSASDQYSLGVVAYELLTGKTPFRGSPLEMQWAHATSAPPSVRAVRPDCPPAIEGVVLRMMAKAPADRWPTLHEVSHALADDAPVASGARTALIALAGEVPNRRDATMPTTPASPVPIGPGPGAVVDATTDPVRRTGAAADAPAAPPIAPNDSPALAPMLTLSQQRIELAAGDSVELVVELDATDQLTDGSSVTWQTSDPAVATVSPDGFVSAVEPGLAEVTCIWRGQRAVCVVHVTPAIVSARPSTALRAAEALDDGARPIVASRTPASAPAPARRRSGQRRWWAVGVVAAGVLGAAVYRGVRPNKFEPAIPPDAATSPATPAAPIPPATAGGGGTNTPSGSAATPERNRVSAQRPATPPTGKAAAPVTGGRGRVQERAASPATATSSTASSSAPPAAPGGTPGTLAPLRPDSVRLTPRVDTGAGYGAARPVPPTSPPPASSVSPNVATVRDSIDRIPPAPRDVAEALFKEFATAINRKSYSRITSAYSQPADAAGVKLWQDFLVFVRDYSPRATVRSTNVNDSAYPPTISATIDFRWTGDAGYDRTRVGTFVGIGVPIQGGWQLHRVELGKRFW
jgi:serine/threonine protein kinase